MTGEVIISDLQASTILYMSEHTEVDHSDPLHRSDLLLRLLAQLDVLQQ